MPRSSMFMQARDGSYPGMNFSSRSLSLSLKKNRVRDVTFGHVVSKMWFTCKELRGLFHKISLLAKMQFEIRHVDRSSKMWTVNRDWLPSLACMNIERRGMIFSVCVGVRILPLMAQQISFEACNRPGNKGRKLLGPSTPA